MLVRYVVTGNHLYKPPLEKVNPE